MPLFPETKMADAHKQSVSGNYCPGEPRDQCLKLRPHLNFVPRFLGADSKTRIFYKYLIFKHFSLFHNFTCRSNTLSPVWLPERILSLSIIHQQTSNTTKWIGHANIPFLSIPCLWDFFQPRKQQLRWNTERNEHLEIRSQHA